MEGTLSFVSNEFRKRRNILVESRSKVIQGVKVDSGVVLTGIVGIKIVGGVLRRSDIGNGSRFRRRCRSP